MLRAVLAAAVLVLSVLAGPSAGADGYQVIVNPDNPVTLIERAALRDAYLNKSTTWRHGETFRPIDLVERFPERERFSREVIGRTAAQVRSYWIQRIFSGKGVPPAEVSSVKDMIARVLADPGAVGYLPPDADPGGAKVIRVE